MTHAYNDLHHSSVWLSLTPHLTDEQQGDKDFRKFPQLSSPRSTLKKSTLLFSCLEMLHPEFILQFSKSAFFNLAEIPTWSWSIKNIYSLHNLLQKGNHRNKITEKQQYPSLPTQAPSYSRNAIIPSPCWLVNLPALY